MNPSAIGAGVQFLPAATGSLARGVPPVQPGTLFALSRYGGISVTPTARFTVVFGRNTPEVHVCVGESDPRVSRQHGFLWHDGKRWTVRNTGILPIRFPGSQLLLTGQEELLPAAYTPLFIGSGTGREHLLEIRVAGVAPSSPPAKHNEQTQAPATWRLTHAERLVMVVLGQRYLRHEAHPQPLPWSRAAAELRRLQPGGSWTEDGVRRIAEDVRNRLSAAGVRALTTADAGERLVNHNLLFELLVSTTLVPPDLLLLDDTQ